jgi:hypothetical protein
MKSAHRHELQTNALAHRLELAIDRLRPYTSTIIGVLIGIVVLSLIWSYVSSSTTAEQSEAWEAYNSSVSTLPPNLDRLRTSAQEYPGTQMQQLADITWADGQVFQASQISFYNRRASTDALNRATTAYLGILQTSKDERLINRAHLGMARVYEMRGELDKAIDEYEKVAGGYADYAKVQIKRLEEPEAKEFYSWYEKAEPPRMAAPSGPGIPGQRPDFSAGDIAMPAASTEAEAPGTEAATNFDELLKGLRELPSTETTPPAEGQTPPTTGETPAPPTTDNSAPPTETPPTDPAAPTDSAPPAENTPAPPTNN